MAITYHTENVPLPKLLKKRLINQWIKGIASIHNKRAKNIQYIFCNNAQILELNRQFLKHDFFTDVITFDYSENDRLNADIYISLDMVTNNAGIYNTPFYEELYRVMIHGILHLCGFKDKTVKEKKQMKKEENQALEILCSKIEL